MYFRPQSRHYLHTGSLRDIEVIGVTRRLCSRGRHKISGLRVRGSLGERPPRGHRITTCLESRWLIIMGYFKPIMVYFGV